MLKRPTDKQVVLLVCAGLVLAVTAAYEPLRRNSFAFDDTPYIVQNGHVNRGISIGAVRWAFTSFHAGNWHPLTWLSHALDCQIFGLKPLGHHLTNVLLHIANSLLLFWVLARMTGATWRSAFVAAAFALHPLRVESVAWAAERKDVLSGLFWMLTMLAYLRYAERPTWGRYANIVVCFALGLMAKPMVVTLPFVLLLLDYWPLGRLQFGRAGNMKRLIAEKIPLLGLSALSSIVTVFAQQSAGAVVGLEQLSFPARLINAVTSYANYIGKTVCPVNLAVLYPTTDTVHISTAIMFIVTLSVCLALFARGRPWFVVGLLWYLGTLVPVSGLVQVGLQSMADRYTYLPSIGFFIVVAWAAGELTDKARCSALLKTAVAAMVLVICLGTTRNQVRYWRNDFSLYEHALAATKNNWRIRYNYGTALLQAGRPAEAARQLEAAVRLKPTDFAAMNNLALALRAQGNVGEAVNIWEKTVQLSPDYRDARMNLAFTQSALGRYNEAINNLEMLDAAARDLPLVLEALERAYAGAGRFAEAAAVAERQLRQAKAAGNSAAAAVIESRIRIYRTRNVDKGN